MTRVRLLNRLKRAPGDVRFSILHRLRWGSHAPRRGEFVAVDPRQVRGYLPLEVARRVRAHHRVPYGAVVGGDWDLDVLEQEFVHAEPYRSCALRWLEGRRWQDTPVYRDYVARIESGQRDRFGSEDALILRYRRLDRIYDQARRERVMSSDRAHMIKINLTRSGDLIYGPDGRHRFAIALLADLNTIPARVGFIHAAALHRFQALRAQPSGRSR